MNQELQERIKREYEAQMLRDRNILTTYLLSTFIALECIDELSAEKTPYVWIKQSTKAAYNNFDRIFKQNHKEHITNLFALKEDDTNEGEVLISTQDGVRQRIEAIGEIISKIPVIYWDEFIEKVMEIKFEPKEQITELTTK